MMGVRMQSLRAVALLGLVAIIGDSAVAQELRPTLLGRTIWTDNVFNQEEKEDDVAVRLTPQLEVVEPQGAFSWRFRYAPSYEYSFDFSDLRGFDHDLEVGFDWRITPKTTLQFSDSFERFRSIVRRNETVVAADGTDSLELFATRNRFVRNYAAISLNHSFNRKHRSSVGYQSLIWNFSEDNRSDVEIGVVQLTHNYAYSNATRLNARATWRSRTNKSTRTSPETESDFYSLSAGVDHAFDPTFKISVNAGPAYVRSEQSATAPSFSAVPLFPVLGTETGQLFYVDAFSCPRLDDGTPFLAAGCDTFGSPILGGVTIPRTNLSVVGAIPDPDDGTLSYFASVGVSKDWDQWSVQLDLVRRADDASSVGAASIETSGSFRVNYRATRRLTFVMRGVYSVREQETESTAFVSTVQPSATPACLLAIGGGCVPGFQVNGQAERVDIRPVLVGRGNERETQRLALNVIYRWSERLRLRANVSWSGQKQEFDGVTVFDRDRTTAWVGFEYQFEPTHF